jgi:EmrB/QacA subfamily drug resistance transporter
MSTQDQAAAAADPRRWRALAVLATVQFILVLDLTVVNVALPHIKHDLHFSAQALPWVVNGYTLMAGGLLLLGGKLGDLFGRRRVFLTGVALFALASICCGAAVSSGMLVTGRFAQGVGEALGAPCGLAIVARLFTDAGERNKAIGLWASLAAVGGVLGVVVSGVLNDVTTWRWIFFINVPVAVIALWAVPRLVAPDPGAGSASLRSDGAGAVLVTGGMVALVYAALSAASSAWGSVSVLAPLVIGLVLLAAFAVLESRARVPLIPPGFFANRTRVVSVTANLLFASAFYTTFFLLTLYMQDVLGWSPLKTGLAYLPYGLLIVVGGGLGSVGMSRAGARVVLAAGCSLAGLGLLLLAMISPAGGYLSHLLPGQLALGLGAGLAFPSLGVAALYQIPPQDSGLASGVRNTAYQAGGSFGLAVLVTIALRRAHVLAGSATPAAAATAGYRMSLAVGGVLMLAAAVLVAVLMQSGVGRRARAQTPAAGGAGEAGPGPAAPAAGAEPAAGLPAHAPAADRVTEAGTLTHVTSRPPQGRRDGSAT